MAIKLSPCRQGYKGLRDKLDHGDQRERQVQLEYMDQQDRRAQGGSVYGHFYNVDAQVVALEADVLFSGNNTTAEFTHAPGTSTITVTVAGTYEIQFSVSGVESNQFAVAVDGVPIAESIYGSGAGTQQNNGLVITGLAAGDVIALRNHTSAAAVTLQILAGGTQFNINASLLIKRLI